MLSQPAPWQADVAAQELLTVSDWIRATASALSACGAVFGQGTTNAIDEARWLVLGTLRLPLDIDHQFDQARLLPHERAHVARHVAARVTDRRPTAYILGEAWLLGLRFRSDPRAIIPRSYLAEVIQDDIFGLDAPPRRILDLCTGSGCLAIQAALQWADSAVVASDISADALALARENIADYGLEQQIELRQADLFSGFPPDERFDLILCNPPYVPAQKVGALPPEFQSEPGLALGSGVDGMDFIRRLLQSLPSVLSDQGRLLCEVGFEQATCERLFEAAFPTLSPLWIEASQPNGAVFSLGVSK